MSGRLAGKVALVMGAGQTPGPATGNGKAIALLFAREGAHVVCADRDLARAEDTVATIGEEGGTAAAIACDVTDPRACADAVAAAAGLSILVNNVGIGGGGDGPAHRLDPLTYDRIMAVNLGGTLNAIAAAVPVLRANGGGAIVNISSLAGIAGGTMVAYEMSKAAVNRLTVSTALANAKAGIRVNAVAPGLIDTPMAIDAHAAAQGRAPDEIRAERSARVPMGAMGSAWDVAHAALYLASDEARFVTGVILPVDGGMGARIG